MSELVPVELPRITDPLQVRDLIKGDASPAFANFGRWVAWCSRPDRCSYAQRLQRLQAGFICPECGASTEVVWPAAAIVVGVERLLEMRLHPKDRAWFPDETLGDLMRENSKHRVFDQVLAELETSPGQDVLTVDDAKGIRLDALPAVDVFRRPPLTTGGC